MKTSIFILSLFFALTVQAQVPETLVGNWIDTQSNDWKYGFFEKFAVYDCDFWDYSSVQSKGKTLKIVLQKEGKTVQLEVNQKNDSLVSIKNGKQKSVDCVLMRKRYPDYKTADTTPFPAPTFRQDSATIVGYYRNFDKIPDEFKQGLLGANYFEIAYYDYFVEDNQENFRTSIDSLGRFSLKVPIINMQLTYADWARLNKMVVLSPNDKLFLFADVVDLMPKESDGEGWGWRDRDKEILFMGDNARLNNELLQFKPSRLYFGFYDEQNKKLSDMEFLKKCEDVYNQRIVHLEKFIADNPKVSEKFRFVNRVSEKYDFAVDLMQRRFHLDRRNGQRFQEGYMDYVKAHFPLFEKENYTLVRAYQLFLGDYIGYHGDLSRRFVSYDIHTGIDILEKEGKLTPELKGYAEEYDQLIAKINAEPDTLKKMEIRKSGEKLFKNINSNELLKNTLNWHANNEFFKMELSLADSLLQEPVIKEWWTASLYFKRFNQDRKPLIEKDMAMFNERITIPFLRNKLLGISDYYAQINNSEMRHEESLKNTDSLANINNPEMLFGKLIEPYRGKIIYLDVWGTWCSSCRENMKLMGDIEKQFQGKDIVFMYLANNSPETTWRNVIKEMKLTGEQIVHYRLPDRQQQQIERQLNIVQFPTYILIDREGKILNREAPSPRHSEILVDELEKAIRN